MNRNPPFSVQPHSHIQQLMKSLCALGQFSQASLFQRLRKTVEQAPDIPLLKCLVPRVSPFVKHIGNVAVRADIDIYATNHQVMGSFIAHFMLLVGFDAFVLMMPFVHELRNGPFHELRKVPIDVNSLFATELHFPAEIEVVKHKH